MEMVNVLSEYLLKLLKVCWSSRYFVRLDRRINETLALLDIYTILSVVIFIFLAVN